MVRIILEDIKLKKVANAKIYSEAKPASVQDYGEAKKKKQIVLKKEVPSFSNQRLERTPQIKTKPKILHKSTLIIFILSIIVGGIYWGGDIFSKIDITITSKHQLITYKNKQFVASKELNDDSINFEIMIVSDKKIKNITLTDSKDVSIKAKGSITLYNEFSSNPQKILAETFLSDNNGKAYKTDTVVTIPGYKIDKNKKIIPGQASVNITAFLPGEAYNGSPTDFHINSFKETTKYNKIYGKLKSPLVGGALGLIYILNDSDRTAIDIIAQSSFKEDLLKQVEALVPPGYILYPNALTFSYTVGDNVLSKTSNGEIEIEGTLSVVLLKEKSLMDNIIKISLPDIKGDELREIKISDLSKLSFNFMNKEQPITKDMSSLSFSLTGDIDAVWNPDVELLKTKLLGAPKNNVLPIFRQDPGIASALLKIFPPWQKYIPNDSSKINIIVD